LNPPDYPHPPTLDTLYCEHHEWLQGWLRRRLGNAADAADLAHDAFMRLMVVPRAFGSRPAARLYLRTMANGLCVDLWRRRQIEEAWLQALAAQPALFAPSAEDQVAVLQALQEIDAMLQTLSPRASRAFVLAVGCEMTDKEVAGEIGVSTRMVRKYVAQAMLLCVRLEESLDATDAPA
jgi:RNA polymerase sigma factor (sigma-70 family)